VTKIRTIVGTTENLELLSEMAAKTVQDARNTAAYYGAAITGGKKKLNSALSRQKAMKAVLRHRNKFPPSVGKEVARQKEDAAFVEAQARGELANFKEHYNLAREVEFMAASMLKLIEERSDVSSNS